MLRVYYKILFLLGLSICLTSCEEVIEVELDKAEPQIVIQASISDRHHQSDVLISSTRDFESDIKFNYKQYKWNYKAIIIEPDGDSVLFADFDTKYYNFDYITKLEGIYSINVIYENTNYTASSYFHKPIEIKKLTAKKKKNHLTNKSYYELHCFFQDNPGVEDFLKFRISVNSKSRKNFFTYDGRLTDGNLIDYDQFYFENGGELELGDTVYVSMYTIDELTFNYFETLKTAISSSGGIPIGQMTPSNPISNWSNGALGYFSAHSNVRKGIIIGKPNEKI